MQVRYFCCCSVRSARFLQTENCARVFAISSHAELVIEHTLTRIVAVCCYDYCVSYLHCF